MGLTGAQIFVLHRLSLNPALSLNELARLTFTHQSSVSVVVQRLVERRLVVRKISCQDGRRLELSVTKEGVALLRKSPDVLQERLIVALMRLPSARLRRLGALSEELVRTLDIGNQKPMMLFEEPKRRRRMGRVRSVSR